ncbi:hypothetical protein A0H81_06189 [Grifola frondosa]|uniref:Uncharacterized protein n=1 Tax=Grifola frondosa TaxID=5627 RepID=A0A1C7MA24_GRIFR|nr:hypothetical protein A0H81_06189 [Grifola frondosa]
MKRQETGIHPRFRLQYDQIISDGVLLVSGIGAIYCTHNEIWIPLLCQNAECSRVALIKAIFLIKRAN